MRNERLARGWQSCRGELTGYLRRLVAREDVAEELAQQAALRMLEAEGAPEAPGDIRAWLFRVATNLAVDHLRRHSTWREEVLERTRGRCERDEAFLAESSLLRGSPEMKSIAREHLAVCLACTLRNLRPEESAALLLREVHGFTVEETARLLDASFGQAKGWIQSARAGLSDRYGRTCALVAKEGACFQCVELDRFFEAGAGDPLAGTARDLDARLAILRENRETPLGRWHRRMMQLVEEVLEGS